MPTPDAPLADAARVLFLVPDLELAGSELRLLDFVKRVSRAVDVHVCALDDEGPLLDELRTTRAEVVILPVGRAYLEWSQIGAIVSYVRDARIDVVNSIDFKTLFIGMAIKVRLRRRVRLVHHFVSLLDNWQARHKLALAPLLKFADAIICNSQVVAERLVGTAAAEPRLRVIENGVDLDHYRRASGDGIRAHLGFGKQHFVLGTVANFRPVKDYPFLVEGFRRLRSQHEHVRLLCVGGGRLLDDVKAMVRDAGLDEDVHFSGFVRDVRPYLESMDAFALCSSKEGFPNAVIQALAMQVPVVSSAVGETSRIIDDGSCGFLFDVGQLEVFVAGVDRLIRDPELCERFRANGRELVERRYAMSRMVEQYEEFFVAMQRGIAGRTAP